MPPLLLLSVLDVVGIPKVHDDAGDPAIAGAPTVVSVYGLLTFFMFLVPTVLASLLR